MTHGSYAPRTLGFTIERFLDLQQWKPLRFDDSVPVVAVPACPCEVQPLRTLCTLVERSGSRRLRIGCCPECGHVTYIDRPTKAWIDEYYRATWDADDLDERVNRKEEKLAAKLVKEKTGVKIALDLNVDRRRPVCEIGCGYGGSLKRLSEAGFTHLVGTESSEHRASVVRRVFGFEVFTAPFESESTQTALSAKAPFSIIYSHHVLEHTYHPDSVISAAGRLQKPGDYLIISVPHHPQEPSMGVLLFLPHLHSFTRASLERVAARYGYALFDDSRTHPKNLNLAFRKTDAPVTPAHTDQPFAEAVEKYVRVLALGRRRYYPRRLWWNRRADQAGQVWMLGDGAIEAWHWERLASRHGYEHHRSVKVTDLGPRFTDVEESPLEIQFREGLALLYK